MSRSRRPPDLAQADEILTSASPAWSWTARGGLAKTATTQPAILAVSWAYLAYLRERAAELGRQIRPSHVSGHSFGQFSAAAAADSISFADALKLVRERGRIMTRWSKRRPGGMASVIGPNDDAVREACEEVSPDGDGGGGRQRAGRR
jgi:[acyl-carrier-protein] S-malonyltransferase